jgi:NitT/TauT family transport system ATP-binding protein
MHSPSHSYFIEVEHLSHTFADGVQALADVSLTIEQGAFVAVVGASGVGKSTLLRILGGLLPPSNGRVHLAGQPPPHPDYPIGVVFQRYNLMPWRTVRDNIRLPLELQGESTAVSDPHVNELVKLVGLEGFADSYPAQLSGGMAQRVAIARALIHRPALLLLDEPFGALDALTRERMGQELLRIWDALPVTVFLVTHSIPEAVLLADEVLVMNGRPGTIATRIPITLPRPRRLEMQASPLFYEHAAAIRAAIQADE